MTIYISFWLSVTSHQNSIHNYYSLRDVQIGLEFTVTLTNLPFWSLCALRVPCTVYHGTQCAYTAPFESK